MENGLYAPSMRCSTGYLEWRSAYMSLRAAKHRAIISEMKTAPCMDCGQTYPPYVMDFDHLLSSEKKLMVSKMVGWSLDTLLAEVSKCDLVCSNCHRIRTFTRKNILKAPHV